MEKDKIDNIELQEAKIDELLEEFTSHRNAIKDMIVDLEKIRTKIDKLIPDNLDNRFVRFFEEKVKSITGLFNSLLEMRKEIAKSAKDEIEIRRRMKERKSEIDEIEESIDIRGIVEKIDNFRDTVIKIKEKRSSEMTTNYDPDIIIPGLNDEKKESEHDRPN